MDNTCIHITIKGEEADILADSLRGLLQIFDSMAEMRRRQKQNRRDTPKALREAIEEACGIVTRSAQATHTSIKSLERLLSLKWDMQELKERNKIVNRIIKKTGNEKGRTTEGRTADPHRRKAAAQR